MGTIKDRNGMDLTEAENIKERWQEYTEKLYKKKKTKNFSVLFTPSQINNESCYNVIILNFCTKCHF